MDFIFAFDDWEFEPASGELRRADGEVARIQPQPAQLLALLLDRAGEVVTREDIVEAVWPDTKVEFDQAVNYAIRHLRSALNESAADDGHIETLPRRGYRFNATVERRQVVASSSPQEEVPDRRLLWMLGLAALVAVFAWGFRARNDVQPGTTDDSALVAILALRYTEGDSLAAVESVRIVERLTDHLTRSAGDFIRIAGPTITGAHPVGTDPRGYMGDSLGASYMVSGRLSPDQPDGLFFELIRIRDGAHVWAMRASPSDTGAVARVADSLTVRFGGFDG